MPKVLAVSRKFSGITAEGGTQTEPSNLKEFRRQRYEFRKTAAAGICGAEVQRGGSCIKRERERDLQKEPPQVFS